MTSTLASDALLEIRNLEVSYATTYGEVSAVRGVSLAVAPGEVLALVGESGSGKSTTAHAVIGLLARGGRVTGGSIVFAGREVATATDARRVRGRSIGLIPQDPAVSLNPVTRVGAQVAEVLEIHRLANGRAARVRAIELLAEAGLPEAERRASQYPHQLSGGMRQRVLIAIALAARPRLVIADEPTSALDVTVQKQVLDHFEALTREFGMSVLLITHDLGVAADRADRIAAMTEGRIIESGPVDRVLSAPEHPYTRQLLASAPGLRKSVPVKPAVSLDSAAVEPEPPPPTSTGGPSPLLSLRGVHKTFVLPRTKLTSAGDVRAVAGVDLDIHPGGSFGLVGESGSGKSTVARLALRLETPTQGEIWFEGVNIALLKGQALRRLRARMQIVYQNPYASLNPRLTVGQVIDEPLRAFRVGDRRSRVRRVEELLSQVALPGSFRRRKPPELSGGQRQRVAIARAIALEPKLLVCDEPVSALDVTVQAQILRLLARLQRELGLSYLFISHDLAVVREVCERVGVMRSGVLVETGPTVRVLSEPKHPYTQSLLAAIAGQRALVRRAP